MTDLLGFVDRVPRRVRLVIALFGIATSLLLCGSQLRLLIAPRPTVLAVIVQDFNTPEMPRGMTARGFTHCLDGWCLAPRIEGEVSYELARPFLADGLMLDFWLYRSEGTSNRVSISTDGGETFTVLAEDVHTSGEASNLTLPPSAGKSVVLRIQARNESGSERLVFDKVIVRWLSGPPVPRFRTRWVLPALGAMFLSLSMLARRPARAVVTAAILLTATAFRLWFFAASVMEPLDPDAVAYLAYADRFRLFSPTGFYSAAFSEREPLYVFVAHSFLSLVGDTPVGLRLLGFALSVLVVWAAILVGRRLFGDFGGCAAGLLMALNEPLAREAPRGLRLELEMLVWLAFLWAAFLRQRRPGILRTVTVGGIGAALVLTRSTYLPVVVALEALSLGQWRRGRWKSLVHVALAALITVGLFAPHRYGLYRRHGDPLWDTAQYARWNANVEFAGRPGFPSRTELQVDSYAGPPLSYSEYLFELHTPRELVGGTLRGYFKLYRAFSWVIKSDSWSPSWWVNLALQISGLAGFAISLLSWRYLWLPAAFILCEFAPSFLYDRQLVESFRHTYQGLPLLIFGILLSGQSLWHRLRSIRHRTRAESPVREAARAGGPRDS